MILGLTATLFGHQPKLKAPPTSSMASSGTLQSQSNIHGNMRIQFWMRKLKMLEFTNHMSAWLMKAVECVNIDTMLTKFFQKLKKPATTSFSSWPSKNTPTTLVLGTM